MTADQGEGGEALLAIWWRAEHGRELRDDLAQPQVNEERLRFFERLRLLQAGMRPETPGDAAVVQALPMLPLLSDDWDQVFDYAADPIPTLGSEAPTTGFTRADVKRIVAMDNGENDGPEWIGVFELHDGRFAVVRAGCDYTGWG